MKLTPVSFGEGLGVRVVTLFFCFKTKEPIPIAIGTRLNSLGYKLALSAKPSELAFGSNSECFLTPHRNLLNATKFKASGFTRMSMLYATIVRTEEQQPPPATRPAFH